MHVCMHVFGPKLDPVFTFVINVIQRSGYIHLYIYIHACMHVLITLNNLHDLSTKQEVFRCHRNCV